ncbi:MAG TPA: hypothetical protein VKM72_28225 [Thermoanaerobaculia bacterium]|nr:hypothetical protein [Thermoanaerobaculia bacterium]
MARPWREIPESEPEPESGAAPVPAALQRVRSALPEELRSRLRSARELDRTLRDEEEEHPPLVTAVPALDRLLDGGLPRGHLVELVGGRTSGRFSTLLSALAAATSIGETAALVDLGDALDPAAAAALGVDLERLLWVRPTDLKEALGSAEMLIGAGFALVVLDLGAPPVRGGRGVEAGWLRLARSARSHGSALLVGSPYRVSGTAASAVLKASRPRTLWQGGAGAPWLLGGLSARIEVEKHRRRLPGQSEGLELTAMEAPPLPAPPAPRPAAPAEERTEREAAWPTPLRAAGGRR